VFGLIVGGIARFLLPGADPMGCAGTIIVGVIGSFVGGFAAYLILGSPQGFTPASFLGSLIGAIIVLLIYRKLAPRRPLT